MNHERHRPNLRRFNQQSSSQSRTGTRLTLACPCSSSAKQLATLGSGPWHRICMTGTTTEKAKSEPSNFSVPVWTLRSPPSATILQRSVGHHLLPPSRTGDRGRKPSAALDKNNNGDGGWTITPAMIPTEAVAVASRGFLATPLRMAVLPLYLSHLVGV
jgi:hypothetical protein